MGGPAFCLHLRVVRHPSATMPRGVGGGARWIKQCSGTEQQQLARPPSHQQAGDTGNGCTLGSSEWSWNYPSTRVFKKIYIYLNPIFLMQIFVSLISLPRRGSAVVLHRDVYCDAHDTRDSRVLFTVHLQSF